MKRIIAIATAALALAGCAPQGPSPEALASYAACDRLKTAVAEANCKSAVEDSSGWPSSMRDRDLLTLVQAGRLSLAQKVDAGSLSRADANLQIARLKSEAISESVHRGAEIAAAMPAPTSCSSVSTGSVITTNCF
jgi:hypothetical protein